MAGLISKANQRFFDTNQLPINKDCYCINIAFISFIKGRYKDDQILSRNHPTY